MTIDSGTISGTHKTQLYSDALHAAVVLIVVLCVTALASAKIGLPPDVIGTVYGGAIGYAAGRAGNVTRSPVVVSEATQQAIPQVSDENEQ